MKNAVKILSKKCKKREKRLGTLWLILAIVFSLGLVHHPAIAKVAFKGEGGLRVMTYNMYLGADLLPAIGAGSPEEFIMAVTEIIQNVRATDPPARVAAIAREIGEVRPHLVVLQEVCTWSTGDPLDVEFDYQQLILDELAARNLQYAPVALVPHFYLVAPSLEGPVALTQSLLVLARTDLPLARFQLSNIQRDVFQTILSIPIPSIGMTVDIHRPWASIDVRFQNKDFRFVATHLEAFSPQVAIAQGGELIAGPTNTDLPVIVAGDLNSDAANPNDPFFPAYQNFLYEGFTDAWLAVNPGPDGFTCCQEPDLSNPTSQLNQRIDFVLVRGPFRIKVAEVFGEEPGDRTPEDIWPSDHASVAARLLFLGQDD